ncbi:ABC transporter permease [Heyndrickxia vini]|uniref:ABC transporter permease n=1 Tax=Heyndrickxia vini TaxID=1476025 RepID=A0ABX7E2Z4_9BACI|nr:ABC transporter permease [Heyndrickxia vini]QQZ09177.1 ABC transporter permease [Heyndrickxia vini]
MKWLYLFRANFRREYIYLKRYLPNTISELITFYAIFLFLFFGIQIVGDPSTVEVNVQNTIVNYLFWFLAMMVMQGIGWSIMNEAQLGTLEQMYMSPMGAWKILLARIISSTILQLIMIVILLYLSMVTTNTWLNVDVLSILPILIFTLISMVGVSFMIAGLAIIFKQIGSFLQIFQFILMGLTFAPLSTMPYLTILPVVKGVDMARGIMIHHSSLMNFSIGDYTSLVANAVVYLILGIVVFKRCEKTAMIKGVLGQH